MRKITAIRKAECTKIRHRRLLHVTSCALGRGSPVLSSAVAILTFRYLGNVLNAGDVFAVVTTFQSMRLPLIMAPLTLSAIENARVSLRRLQTFLIRPEVTPRVVPAAAVAAEATAASAATPTPALKSSSPSLSQSELAAPLASASVIAEMETASFSYRPVVDDGVPVSVPGSDSDSAPIAVRTQQIVLHDMSLQVKKGTLTAIVGSVGSGKSTLVQASKPNALPHKHSVNSRKPCWGCSARQCCSQSLQRATSAIYLC